MTHAVVIKENGTIQKIEPKNGEKFSLEELQKTVGGYIEIGRTHDGDFLVMDEEGKLKGKGLNEKATELYQFDDDFVVGDVLVCPTSMID